MELTQLQHFVAVASTQNMTHAAETLFISQPAISYSLRKLEKELGVQLFDRTGNSVLLNEQGKLALAYAKDVLEAANRMTAHFQKPENRLTELTVYASTVSAIRYFVPRFLAATSGVHVSTKMLEPEDLAPALLRRACDLVFSNEPIPGRGVHCMPFCRDSLCAYLPQGHPLYDRRAVHLRELRGSQTIHLTDSLAMTQKLFALLKQENVDYAPMFIDDYQVYRSTILLSDKVAFVSTLGIPYYEDVPGRRFVRLMDRTLQMPLYICYLEENTRRLEPFFRWLRENYRTLLR